jgi:hypothetical protein
VSARTLATNVAISDLQVRWDAFLQKIEARVTATLDEAEPALLDMWRADRDGILAVITAWQAVQTQLQVLIGRIGSTWSEQVGPGMEAHGFTSPGYDWHEELARGEVLAARLRLALARREIVIRGALGRAMHHWAITDDAFAFTCSRCKAPLHVTTDIFNAHYETCAWCSTVNTYEPSTRVRSVEWFACDAIAAADCLRLWDALQLAESDWSAARRPVPEPIRTQYRAAALAHHRALLHARIAVNPALATTFDADTAQYERRILDTINR